MSRLLARRSEGGEEAVTAIFLDRWRGPVDASLDYLWAYLHALRGEFREARTRIAQCLRKDPGMRPEVDGNPAFAALLRQSSSSHSPNPTNREGYT